MGKAFRASLLVLLLACSAQAGYMPNGSPAPPDPPPGVAQSDTTESLTQTVLDLLAALPSLF